MIEAFGLSLIWSIWFSPKRKIHFAKSLTSRDFIGWARTYPNSLALNMSIGINHLFHILFSETKLFILQFSTEWHFLSCVQNRFVAILGHVSHLQELHMAMPNRVLITLTDNCRMNRRSSGWNEPIYLPRIQIGFFFFAHKEFLQMLKTLKLNGDKTSRGAKIRDTTV